VSENFTEHVVYQCKLHRGIFLLPIFLLLVLIFPATYEYVITRNEMAVAYGEESNAFREMSQALDKSGLGNPQISNQFINQLPVIEPSYGSFLLRLLLPDLEFALLGVAVFYVIVIAAYFRSEVVLTEHKLRFSTGLFSFSTAEIFLSKIETMQLVHPLFGRLLGYGTVAVTGTGGTVFRLQFLPKPEYLYSLLQQMTNEAPSAPTPSVQQLSKELEDMHTKYMPKGQN
jgi:hypothetical protein